ncbi:MAG: hypothetical protein R6U55_08510 [Desulfovermiculus sp.]
MYQKYPIRPQRLRKVPRQFSWVDHRLVRDFHIDDLNHAAAALYLFLVTVGDHQGLSYYSDAIVIQRLCMDERALQQARSNLIQADLIAWKKPLYQVLSIQAPPVSQARAAQVGPVHFSDILNKLAGGSHD